MSGRAEHPAVSRWRVRHALRQARDAKELTQTQVADAMEWSLSKVQRIELGEVNISATDLRSLLDLLGIADPAIVSGLLEEARKSRRERWVIDAAQREHLTPNTVQQMQFEAVADSAKWFVTYVLPASLQTPAYSEAVLRFFDPNISDSKVKVHLDARAQRRQAALNSDEATELRVIVYEPLLMMNVGSVDVMAEQLRDLAASARHPNVRIRILPLSEGLLAGLGMFGLFRLDHPVFAGEVLYREMGDSDLLDDDHSVVELHRTAFVEAWERSLSEERSARRMIAQAAALEAE